MFMLVENRKETGIEMKTAAMETMDQLMADHDNIMFFEADLGNASGSLRLAAKYPDQYVETGICEANMIGMAAGMSTYGFSPFVHSFAPFVSRRVFDQVFLSGGYAGNTLHILGTDPGFHAAANGGTHTTFEDMAMMRTIPDSVVAEPADAIQLGWLLKDIAHRKGIHYIRTTRKAVRRVYEENSMFVLGKGNLLRQGSDVLIVACGPLVSDALDAAELLEMEGWSVSVIDMFTIKPLDTQLLVREARDKKAVVTFENHNVTGGLGTAVAECLLEEGIWVPFKRMGITEAYGQVGSVDYLQKAFGLRAIDLVETVESMLPEASSAKPWTAPANMLKKAFHSLGTSPRISLIKHHTQPKMSS